MFLRFTGVKGLGLGGESHPSSQSEPDVEDECDGEGEVETSEDRTSRVGETEGDFEGETEGDFEGDLRMGE